MQSSSGLNNQTVTLDFTTFLLSISSAAFMALDATTTKPDLPMARQNIELLELMLEKTKGNRTPDEEKLLQHLLFEVRMKFVDVQKTQGK